MRCGRTGGWALDSSETYRLGKDSECGAQPCGPQANLSTSVPGQGGRARVGLSSMGTILIDKLLLTVVNRNASDLHIAVGQPPVLRLHGRLVKLETKTLEAEDTIALMKSITPERCQQELQEAGSTDFGFAFGDKARFRVSVFKQRGFTGMVLRQIPNDLLSMEQLGTPSALRDLILRPRGLVLVTGPTGSGKSTTLAACIDYLNDNVDHHIITIEDPIEFYHYHKKSTVNQREVARGRSLVRRGDSTCPASGPGRHPGG